MPSTAPRHMSIVSSSAANVELTKLQLLSLGRFYSQSVLALSKQEEGVLGQSARDLRPIFDEYLEDVFSAQTR